MDSPSGKGERVYIQARVVATTPDEAATTVQDTLARDGYSVVKLVIFPCRVQPFDKGKVWYEWLAEVTH